jgi:hypothetical protein
MSVDSVKGANGSSRRDGSVRGGPDAAEEDAFARAVMQRKGGRSVQGADDELRAEASTAGVGAAQICLSTLIRIGQDMPTGSAKALLSPTSGLANGPQSCPPDLGLTEAGREAQEVRLRFPGGPWAGLEIQATMHAGSIVLALNPQTRLQERRLSEGRYALISGVKAQTGIDIHIELKEARDVAR